MITIVMPNDVVSRYGDIDNQPEPFYPEPMGNSGDSWSEITIEDEDDYDPYVIANRYNININHIIDIGVIDENDEVTYTINK